MKIQKGSTMIIIGIPLLIVGIILYFVAPSFSADNLQIARNARSAMEAAQAISKNNRMELLFNTVGMFLIGMGGMISVFGAVKYFQDKNSK